MSLQKVIGSQALSALASDIKASIALKADQSDTYTKEEVDDKIAGNLPEKSASGAIATFETNYAGKLKSLSTTIVAQGGGGTPSTPIPIVGYSEVNLTRCGVNFTDLSDNTIAVAGYVIGPAPQYINGEHFYLPSGKYTFSFDITNATYPNACQIIVYGHGIEVTRETKSGISQSGKITITFTANAEFNQMLLYCNSSTGGSFSNFQMEVGSTAHSYEPYNGTTHTIALGSTVYGGELDVTSGVLTITHDHIASYNGESINEPWISSMDEYVPNTSPSTGAEVVYPMTTPQTVQLTPTQVHVIVGTNNVFSDCGNTELEYYYKVTELASLDDVNVSNPVNGQVLKYDSASDKWINATGGGSTPWTDVTGTLTAGQTSITLSNPAITTSSTLDYYTDTFGVNPTSVSVANGSVTLTFEAQASNLGVKVRVS